MFKAAMDVADAITFLDNAYKTFGQTIQKIQLPTTPFANLRTSIRDIAAGFETIAAGAPMLADDRLKTVENFLLEQIMKECLGIY